MLYCWREGVSHDDVRCGGSARMWLLRRNGVVSRDVLIVAFLTVDWPPPRRQLHDMVMVYVAVFNQ